MKLLMAGGGGCSVDNGACQVSCQSRFAEGVPPVWSRDMAFYLECGWRSSRCQGTCFLAQTNSLILFLHFYNQVVLSLCCMDFKMLCSGYSPVGFPSVIPPPEGSSLPRIRWGSIDSGNYNCSRTNYSGYS